jgi:hypothetical protein
MGAVGMLRALPLTLSLIGGYKGVNDSLSTEKEV